MVYKNNFAIAIKDRGGHVLREHGEEVYLPFGSEYSILLKNLDSRKALAHIYIDGKDVMECKGLILNGNSNIDLKRFLLDDDMSKGPRFKFIEKTSDIERYRGNKVDDGIVRVEYQFEQKNLNWSFTYHTPFMNDGTDHSHYSHYYYNQYTTCNTISDQSNNCFNVVQNNLDDNENGITVKGTEVNQNFQYGYINTLESESHVICLRLKGGVKKPVTVKTKKRCEICGKKNTSKNKFCFNCGNNLNW